MYVCLCVSAKWLPYLMHCIERTCCETMHAYTHLCMSCLFVHDCVCTYLDDDPTRARALRTLVQWFQQSLGALGVVMQAPSCCSTYGMAVLWAQAVSRRQLGNSRCVCAGPILAFACVCTCCVCVCVCVCASVWIDVSDLVCTGGG
jgi:hypothetical protein